MTTTTPGRHLISVAIVSTVLAVALSGLSGLASEKAKSKGTGANPPQKLYVQFSFMYEKHVHRTTNYRKGILVPVNTEVSLLKQTRKTIVVALPGGLELTIENIEPYSGETIEGILARTLSTNKVDLSSFSEMERKAIAAGEVSIGMSKKAVVTALGYPPKHKTPSLESNQWRYWRNRFGTFVVHFEDDRVSRIQE